MEAHDVSMTLSDVEDLIYAAKEYCRDNVRHPGLSARQRWHRLSNTLAKLELARDEILAGRVGSCDPRPPLAPEE